MQIVLHWQAIALAALVGTTISAIWYSPLVFHKAWSRLSGLSDEALKAGFGLAFGLSVLGAFLQALCLDGFFNFTGSNNFAMGAMAGLQLCLGLVIPAMVAEHAFGRRPWALLALNVGPVLINAVLMGGLIASMR